MSDRNDVVVRTEGVEKVYDLGRVKVPAVRGVDLRVEHGEFVGIMGPSGCGKSTLLYLVGGLATPTRGNVYIEGTDVTGLSDAERTSLRREKIGFVFQRFNLFSTLSALENVQLAQQIQDSFDGTGSDDAAIRLLERVGLADKAERRPMELSIGEQQRVAVARALVNNPAILLADEPTGNLDTENAREVLRLFEELNEGYGQTVLMITHNPEVAARAHRKILMRDGAVLTPNEVL